MVRVFDERADAKTWMYVLGDERNRFPGRPPVAPGAPAFLGGDRLECVGETLRHALNTLATVAPDWLRIWVPSAWFDRYGRRFEDYRLPNQAVGCNAISTGVNWRTHHQPPLRDPRPHSSGHG